MTTGEINESWTAVFVFLGVRKLTAVTTKFLTVYFRFFLAMYPAMTLSVSIVTFLKFLLVFRQNKKNCIERAPIYRRNIVCPCNVYNKLHLELKRAFYEKISKVNTITIVDSYTQLNYGLYNFSKLGRRQFEGGNTAKRIKAVVEETVRVMVPTNNKTIPPHHTHV